MSIEWREAAKDDRDALRRFECTTSAPKEPGRRARPHTKPWEMDVQKAIHTLTPPYSGTDGTCLLGIASDDELATVSLWCPLLDLPGVHKIRLIGVSTSHRGQGGAVAHECLEQTLAMLATQTPGERALGLIDSRNLPSQRLVSSLGFVEVNLPGIGPDLGAWVIDLPD